MAPTQPFTFLQNREELQEAPSSNDLFSHEKYRELIEHELSDFGRHATVGLVGEYGIGKSSLVKSVEATHEEFEWVYFNAWQFPNKGELWDGFAIECAAHFNQQETTEQTIAAAQTGMNVTTKLAKAAAAFVPVVGSGVSGLVDVVHEMQKALPVTRHYQYFQIVKDLIGKSEKPVVFVMEDVDRAGEDGIRFVETFRYFVEESGLQNKVLALVLVGKESYSNSLSSYAKCLDTIQFFDFKDFSFNNFFNHFLDEDQLQGLPGGKPQVATHLSELFEYLFSKNPHLNPRLLKLILRRADKTYDKIMRSGRQADPRLVILFETARFTKDEGSDAPHFDGIIREQKIYITPFSHLVHAMFRNESNLYRSRRNGKELIALAPNTEVRLIDKENVDKEFWLGEDPLEDGKHIYVQEYYTRIM